MMRIVEPVRLARWPRARVLIVDGSAETRAAAGSALQTIDIVVAEASTGATAITAIHQRPFDLALVNARLPDTTGVDLMTTVKGRGIVLPWMLVGSALTPSTIVKAMRLGALDALEWPFDVATVVGTVLHDTATTAETAWPALPPPSSLAAPRSAAERWAVLVLRGCSADHDLKTIHEWAHAIGASYSTLTDGCRLAGIRPHDARDFLRILRALFLARGRFDNLVHGLSIADSRTAKTLFAKAGLELTHVSGTITLRDFIDRQRFVDPTSDPIAALLRLLDDTRH